MRRALTVCCALAFVFPAVGHAARPAVSASPAAGPAPLAVTLTADAQAHWDFGDGTSADGAVVQHTYAAGTWMATATAGGESATVQVEAGTVTLAGPRTGGFGKPLALRGVALPGGVPVALYSGSRELAVTQARADGSFRIRLKRLTAPGPYVARTALASSSPLAVAVRPEVTAAFTGSGSIGRPLAFTATLRPRGAGKLHARIWRAGRLVIDVQRTGPLRIPLPTGKAVPYRAAVSLVPTAGYAVASTAADATVVDPNLHLGSAGPSVRALEQRLAAMHYALRGVDGRFDDDTYDAVLAFQKVHGLARTGRVDASLWQRVATGTTPPARYPRDHVEVDKIRQVLFEVRDGKVALVVPVSTGATGNTPLGRWHVYRRVPGFDWVLYYPTYFLRGFAIHGYPSVPAYPASHGCVRVPMWVAPRLYAMNAYDETVYVY